MLKHENKNDIGLLPHSVRSKIEKLWQGDRVEIYAKVDLADDLSLTEDWLVLGRSQLAYATKHGSEWRVMSLKRDHIKAVKEIPALSCTRLLASGESGTLLSVRYSHRQRGPVGHIAFLLEQQTKDISDGGGANPDASTNSNLRRVENDVSDIHVDRSDQIYLEAVLKPVKEAQASRNVNRMAVVWRLLGYLRPYKRQVAFGMLGACLMTLASLLPPFFTGYIIDKVIKPFERGELQWDKASELALVTIAGLALVFVFREMFAWVRLRTMSTIGEYVASDLRKSVYGHMHKLSLSYFSTKQTGSLISRVSSDTDRIWDFVAFGVVEVTTSMMTLMALSIVLLFLDWRLALWVVIPIPFVLYAISLHGKKMQDLFLRAWRKWSALTDCLSDTIPGVRVVKAFNKEVYEVEKFNDRNDSVTSEFNRIHAAWTTFWPGLMLGIQAIVLSVWVVGLPRVLHAPDAHLTLSAGVFVSFVLYLTMLTQPIEVIGQMARMVNRATSSAYRVFEVLDTQPQVVDQRKSLKPGVIEGLVSFRNVYFSYDGVRQILKNVSFDIRPGEMIGLVGPSGSGKTTIINLLARFYDVTSGEILIDGVSLKDLDSGAYRRQLGMVLQDPYLFHGSILENIRYARPEATLHEVVQAAKAANAHAFISKLPHGYDTTVGERGHTLSGGERQRVSIARAILLNPRILILDEATSAVDTETERQIQEAMDRLVKGRTVFAIAHRLSTLTKADRLLVVKDGRLVEEGTHSELLKISDGVYKKLYTLQNELHNLI